MSISNATGVRRLTRTVMAACLLVAAGCDGDNLFSDGRGTAAGPPVVTAINVPATAAPGTEIDLQVRAVAPSGLANILVRLSGAVVDSLAFPFTGRTDTVTVNTTVQIPSTAGGTDLVIEATATDATGRVSPVLTRTVPIGSGLSTAINAEILAPREGDSRALTDSLLVRVHVTDPNGIASVRLKGVAIRTDSLENTVVVDRYTERIVPFPQAPGSALPTDTVIQRFLRPTGALVSEPVYIIVTAADAAGNTRADTVRIVDGPSVDIVNPSAGIAVGLSRTLMVNIRAADRTIGLDSVQLLVSGVVSQTVSARGLAGRESIDTVFAVSTGPNEGSINLSARTWNRAGVVGSTGPVAVNVVAGAVSDTVAPRVLRVINTTERVELNDSIRVTVRATDGSGSGIARMGIVVVAVPDAAGVQQQTFTRTTESFDPALSGTPERVFHLMLGEFFNEQQLMLPRKFSLQVHAFAIDADGNCGASVSTELAALACTPASVTATSMHMASGGASVPLQLTAVKGKSVQLPGGGRIADAVVDASRRRVYLSNIQNNRVEIFHLGADTFDITGGTGKRGLVGAAPWGMVMNLAGDSLYVANSGGTNISIMALRNSANDPSNMVEDVSRRILTPNATLLNVQIGQDLGLLRYTATVAGDFSDRPQFIAQHSTGMLVYSTLPTSAATAGTLRYADLNAGPQPEVYLLHQGAVTEAENSIALAHLDSMRVVRLGSQDQVILFDRVPGTNTVIMTEAMELSAAIEDIREQGSDVEAYAGTWNIGQIGLRDTTFVTASSDRNVIAIGEGAASPFGRVFLCCTISAGTPLKLGLSSVLQVRDLVNNAAERVFGLGLNGDGSLGVARGANAAYFFSRDLRLQGEFRSGIAGGAGGASMHPNHAAVLETGDRALAFVSTGSRTVKIIDSAHFYERGEIHIRDNVVGPVRAVLPDFAENLGFAPTDPNYIVVKLIAVTEGNHVVVVNVRRKDVTS